MDSFAYVLVGLVQGITEWLPVSSKSQDMLVMGFMGLTPEMAYSVAIFLHFGTLLAVLIRMRSDVAAVVMRLPAFRQDKLVQFLIVSTALTAIVGAPIYFLLRKSLGEWGGGFVLAMIGAFLLLTGLFIYASKKVMGTRKMSDITFIDMVVLGFAQAVTPLPGVSRSGVTVSALLLRGIKQEDALRLSFLMSIPAVVGALCLELLLQGFVLPEPEIIAGVFAALLAGYLTIDLLLKVATKLRFDVFCIVFGLLALLVPIITQAL
jgi:undecaprenyl-diphosphatase